MYNKCAPTCFVQYTFSINSIFITDFLASSTYFSILAVLASTFTIPTTLHIIGAFMLTAATREPAPCARAFFKCIDYYGSSSSDLPKNVSAFTLNRDGLRKPSLI